MSSSAPLFLVHIALVSTNSFGVRWAGLVLVKVVGTMLKLLTSTALLLSSGQAVSAGETLAYAVTRILALACTTLYFRAARSWAGTPTRLSRSRDRRSIPRKTPLPSLISWREVEAGIRVPEEGCFLAHCCRSLR